MKLEGVIHHDGRDWVLHNETITARGESLEELDLEVAEQLRKNGTLAPGETATMFMAFDNGTIPEWIRQYPYGQHYFNRLITMHG